MNVDIRNRIIELSLYLSTKQRNKSKINDGITHTYACIFL